MYASCSALPPPHATLASRQPATVLPGPDLHRLIAPALPGAFPHSINSSARARSLAGTVMPSALAVFILMTSWKRVGCSTGKSAGWAPLRILSTYTADLRKRSAYIAEFDISPPSSTNQRGTETAGTRCCSASSAARLLGRLG